METISYAVLYTIIGFLGGSILTFLGLYLNSLRKTSKHEAYIKTLFKADERHEKGIDKAVQMHTSTLGLLTKIVDQNNLLIQKVTVQ